MGFELWMCSALQWGQSEEPGSPGVLLLANSMTLSRSLHLCGPPVFLLLCVYISSGQSLSHVQLFATPWTAACQPSLSITNSLFDHFVPFPYRSNETGH